MTTRAPSLRSLAVSKATTVTTFDIWNYWGLCCGQIHLKDNGLQRAKERK